MQCIKPLSHRAWQMQKPNAEINLASFPQPALKQNEALINPNHGQPALHSHFGIFVFISIQKILLSFVLHSNPSIISLHMAHSLTLSHPFIHPSLLLSVSGFIFSAQFSDLSKCWIRTQIKTLVLSANYLSNWAILIPCFLSNFDHIRPNDLYIFNGIFQSC